jgi:methylthioribose-1-phosphate isomerase
MSQFDKYLKVVNTKTVNTKKSKNYSEGDWDNYKKKSPMDERRSTAKEAENAIKDGRITAFELFNTILRILKRGANYEEVVHYINGACDPSVKGFRDEDIEDTSLVTD